MKRPKKIPAGIVVEREEMVVDGGRDFNDGGGGEIDLSSYEWFRRYNYNCVARIICDAPDWGAGRSPTGGAPERTEEGPSEDEEAEVAMNNFWKQADIAAALDRLSVLSASLGRNWLDGVPTVLPGEPLELHRDRYVDPRRRPLRRHDDRASAVKNGLFVYMYFDARRPCDEVQDSVIIDRRSCEDLRLRTSPGQEGARGAVRKPASVSSLGEQYRCEPASPEGLGRVPYDEKHVFPPPLLLRRVARRREKHQEAGCMNPTVTCVVRCRCRTCLTRRSTSASAFRGS